MKKILLWLLVLLIPTQLGFHFWPDFSFVSGFRIDYLSPTIYLVDLIIASFLLLSYPILKKLKPNYIFLALIILNTIFSNQPLLTLFFWAKLSIYLLLLIVLSKTVNLKKVAYSPLLISTIFITSVQLTQLILQKSINGPLYFLGERLYNFYTPNIAKISLGSLGVIIRPYSTFSHPNSLAGFLLISLVVLKSYPAKRYLNYIKAFISLCVILTFSKMAIFTLLILQINSQKIKNKIIQLGILIGFLPLLVVFTNLNYAPGDSFQTRAFMGYSTFEIVKDNFLTGTGLKAFISTLPQHLSPSHLNQSLLQPVHSLPLLLLAEIGVLGVLLLVLITKPYKANSSFLTNILIVLALTGAVDHYWWTLPQNQLILILAFAISYQKKNDPNK